MGSATPSDAKQRRTDPAIEEEAATLERDLSESDESTLDEASDAERDEVDEEIEETQFKVVQEKNEFYVNQVAEFVHKKSWVNIRPEYQRRRRWDERKQSLLIESLLLNIPIPPIFLYERRLGAFEVMDGQQRVNAIVDFMNDKFELNGLAVWPSLDGLTYSQCSSSLRKVINRRKLTAISMSAHPQWTRRLQTKEGLEVRDLRRIVFQRLNTGGEKLNAQELRNCLYSGRFNDLIVALAADNSFESVWGIPRARKERNENTLFKTMGDCQIVLRFFAFSNPSAITGSVRSTLDRCMERNLGISQEECEELHERFLGNFRTATKIFGETTFRLLPDGRGHRRLSVPLYDAIMVALDQLSDSHRLLVRNRDAARRAVEQLLKPRSATREIIVGRPNRADAVRSRIRRVRKALENSLD